MSTTLNVPELKETEAALTAKRAELKRVFDEAGPDLDMSKVKSLNGDSAAKVEAIRALNDEIDDLARKSEDLRALKRIGERALDTDNDSTGAESGDDRPSGGGRKATLGEQFVKSAAYQTKGVVAEIEVELKTLMSTTAGWAPQPDRRDRLVPFATRPIELLDLIPTVPTNSNAVNYFQETTFTNAAAETAEGATKPEAALAVTEATAPVRKIAVLLPVTDEQLEDEPRVKALIDNRLPFMVRQRLSLQVIVGDGTAPNLRGVLNVAGIQTQAKGADPTPDAVYKAMVKVMTTGQAMPDLYVTNPLDWQDVRLLRTADGIYIWGNPADAGPERIWGLNVALVQGITENTGVVGDFQNFSELDVRKDVSVSVGYNADDWARNRQTFKAEMRAAFLIYRPAAFCTVTGI